MVGDIHDKFSTRLRDSTFLSGQHVISTLKKDILAASTEKTVFKWMPLISALQDAPMLCCSPKKSLSSYVAAVAAAASRQLHAARLSASSGSAFLLVLHTSFLHMVSCSEVGALGRLRQLLVGGRGHVSSDLDEYGLHGEVAFPVGYAGELGEIDL